MRRLTATLLVGCLIPACDKGEDAVRDALADSADSADGADVVVPPLRDGAMVLASDASAYVVDLSQSGDHLAVLVGHYSGAYVPDVPDGFGYDAEVVLSDDGGGTWRHLALPAARSPNKPRWVHRTADALWVVEVENSGPDGFERRTYHVHEVDLTSGATTRSADLAGGGRIAFTPDAIATLSNDGGSGVRLGLADLTPQPASGPALDDWPRISALTLAPVSSLDGVHWTSVVYTRDERCLLTAAPSAPADIARACVERHAWPISGTARQTTVARPDGVYQLYTARGHTFARRFAAGVLGAELDLGPGLLGEALGRRFGDLVRLSDGSSARLLAFEDGAARDASIPASACADPAGCELDEHHPTSFGYGALHAAVRFGDGSVGAIYREGPGLLYRRVRAGDPGTPPFVAPSPDTLAIGAPQAASLPADSALELACARALACFPGETVAECLGYWSEVRGGAGDPRFAAFVAAETCDALGSAWPAASAGRVEPCVAACYGSVAVRACGGVGMRRQAFDCADVGTSCVDNAPPIGPSCGPYAAADCNTCDDDGRAVRCDGASGVKTRSDCAALGRSCQVVAGLPKCVGGATTCGACEAGVLTVCSDEDFGSVDVDCARLGLECVDGNASCGVVSGLTTQCQGATSACDGDLLTYCAAGASRFIDCGDAGGTCQPLTPGGTTEGACVPAPR